MVLQETIICSDEDQPIVADISTGFDDRKNLVIKMEYTDYEDSRYDTTTIATVSFEDARTLAGRLRTNTLELPQVLADEFEGEPGILYSTNDVKGVFKEILDFLVDYGIHYRLSEV